MGPYYLATGSGRIVRPELASPIIGSGGNYRQRDPITRLLGKIQGTGEAPHINAGAGNPYLSFRASAGTGRGNDRSELTTGAYLPFDRDVLISFRLRLPERVRPQPGFAYVAQLWQQAPLSPIGGLRIKPGSSHTLQVLPGGGEMTLRPGRWHQISMRIEPNGVGSPARITSRLSGQLVSRTVVPFGRLPHTTPGYRLKWGLYRTQGDTPLVVHFDDVSVSLL